MRTYLKITIGCLLATHASVVYGQDCTVECAVAPTAAVSKTSATGKTAEATADCETECAVAPSAFGAAKDFSKALGFEKPDLWMAKELRNKIDPLDGKSASSDLFVRYEDEENQIFGRIYFSGTATHAKAEALGEDALKQLFRETFFARKDGSLLPYRSVRLKLNNDYCPVSGVGKPDDLVLKVDRTMSENCTGTSCSTNNGFKANYNGVQINTCCVTCRAVLLAAPEWYMANVQPFIDRALDIQLIETD